MPRRKITVEAIASMKMLYDQGVKVSMIAEVLGISNWTVYQVRNADWDFDSYKDRTRMHFDKQKKSVKRDALITEPNALGLTTNPDTQGEASDEWGAYLNEQNGSLTIGTYPPVSDKLQEVITQLTQLNTTFEKLLSFFETEGRTV
tara:strand:- start:882 stop:1319 length:438 start_codon:yes stop_codon:yes gene_type:complete